MRLCLICFSLMLLSAAPIRAADEAKPNTLTPKEIADGWLLLFDGETTFGWQMKGETRVDQGSLILGGKEPTTATFTTAFPMDFDLQLDQLVNGKEYLGVTFVIKGSEKTLKPWNGDEKSWRPLTLRARYDPATRRHTITSSTGSVAIAGGPEANPVTLRIDVPAGSKYHLRNLKIKPLELKPIFNGKDLAGWKEFPGRKSKFTVTPEGWLNIKNGPGDLQTETQYADFVLQLECISNGKNLNSGVFFRCRPNEYQQGYEAQIHNGFTAEANKEYTIEEYDPKTNELKDKKKIKATALDYGTGAIYRRIPARKQMAKDNEWFTMTVVARGRHMATWVNGVQMVDWTDNRPLKDNARNGCRLEAGPISLQGHDPTTDLSFRNFRIGEFEAPGKK